MAQILAFVDDIFFQAKMFETAKHTGVELRAFSQADALAAECTGSAPALIVVDLNARGGPVDLVAKLRDAHPRLRIISFFSHVQTELARAAKGAGSTEVMPRSKFTRDLPAIFRSAASPEAQAKAAE